MIIEGRKNPEFIKRTLLSHLVTCSTKALRDDEKTTAEIWDPEIAETNTMLDAVEKNLEQFREDIPLAPFNVEIIEHAGFFR